MDNTKAVKQLTGWDKPLLTNEKIKVIEKHYYLLSYHLKKILKSNFVSLLFILHLLKLLLCPLNISNLYFHKYQSKSLLKINTLFQNFIERIYLFFNSPNILFNINFLWIYKNITLFSLFLILLQTRILLSLSFIQKIMNLLKMKQFIILHLKLLLLILIWLFLSVLLYNFELFLNTLLVKYYVKSFLIPNKISIYKNSDR